MVKYLIGGKTSVNDSMVQVLGIGGFFFRSKDPDALAAWYQTHLGINPAPTDETTEPWVTDRGVTVFSPFDESTDDFPQDRRFMLNFRVENLGLTLGERNATGIESGAVVRMDGVGKFARIPDPEGNPRALWDAAE